MTATSSRFAALLLSGLACLLPLRATALNDASADERALKAATQALLDAIAPGQAAVWNRWLDPAVIQVDENNVIRGKAEILKALQPLPPGLAGHLRIAEWRIARKDNVAVVTHEDDETLDYHGQMLRSRFRTTDTWHRTPHGWRLLGSQVLAVHQDPPAMRLDAATLCAYAGQYALTPGIQVTARCDGDKLVFQRADRPDRAFLPELKDQFFEPGQPRTRRLFQRDVAGAITGFVDRREERDIRWTRLPCPVFHTLRRIMTQPTAPADWEARVAAVWSRVDTLAPQDLVATIDALCLERPADDPLALFERACARDTAGIEDGAEPLYRAALASGKLDPYRHARASIQLGSTLRHLGRLDESEQLLLAQLARCQAEGPGAALHDEVRAVLAFTWIAQGRTLEAAALALETLAPHLTRYNRSMAANARALRAHLGD